MKQIQHLLGSAALIGTGAFSLSLGAAAPAESIKPLASPELVFEEANGLLAFEAEHFYQQTLTEKRAWHITSSKSAPDIKPDGDPPHVAGASGGAYLEALPDTRRTDKDKLIDGENFSNQPGKMAVLHYKVRVHAPGRYYVWVRSYSTGAEDNGLHIGLNGQWPESGQRWQTVQKQKWAWDCKQRTQQVHTGVPMGLFLDIEKAGDHEILVALREDGFEFDKLVLAKARDFKPEGLGPAVKVAAGKLPEPFPFVAAPPPPTPSAAAAVPAGAFVMKAADFPLAHTGYYLDRGQWLAINPDKNKEAKTGAKFPLEDGQYNILLQAVGEEDGKSQYELLVNGKTAGTFECPLSAQAFEEGANFAKTFAKVDLKKDDLIEVRSRIASEDGVEHSRARWSRLVFTAADGRPLPAATATESDAPAPPPAPAAPLVLPRQPDGDGSVKIEGELKQWHKVTLTLNGPYAHERDNDPNPFTDYRMTVRFEHESGSPRYEAHGYFAADGNAANTSADAGTRWRAHLSPDKPGRWTYVVSLVKGRHAALAETPPGVAPQGAQAAPGNGKRGEFTVAPTDKTGRDFRAQGRLQYVGKHFLQFAGSQEYFLKAGADAPENLLGYADFDGTYSIKRRQARAGEATPGGLKTWAAHAPDWKPGDPAWKNGKGKGLIGALNYLAGKGCNVFSFLPYNVGGDGQDVWPFIAPEDKFHYDCSKLDQWGIVFDHATTLGLYLHFKLQEQENDDNRRGDKGETGAVKAALDGGNLGPERRLYCRELTARFSHALALNWNLGEENTQSAEQQREMARYLRYVDPYDHHIVVHTFPGWQDRVYPQLLGDKSVLTGASLQNEWEATHQRTLKWVTESAKAGKPWVVANDEQGPANLGVPPDPGYAGHDGKAGKGEKAYDLHDIRKHTLWGNLMAGGAGVEYYFGYQLPQNDLVCEDWRSRDKSWDYCRYALEFFRAQKIPFWEMANANALIGNSKNDNSRYCLAKPGEAYLVYLPHGVKTGAAELDLKGAPGSFGVQWFNPRAGGALRGGTVAEIAGGGKVSLGEPPADAGEDWLAVVRKR